MASANLGLLKAQKENIEADTANKQGQAANQPKTGANIDANTALQQAQTKMQEIQNKVQGATIDEQIQLIQETADQAVQTAMILQTQVSLDRQTKEEKVSLLQAQTAETLIRAALGKQNIAASQAEVNKWSTELKQTWAEQDIQKTANFIHAFEADIKAKYPGLWNVIGKGLNDAMIGIGNCVIR